MDIKAESKEEAEEIMQKFISAIAPIMADKIRWEESDWEIKESNLVEGAWLDV